MTNGIYLGLKYYMNRYNSSDSQDGYFAFY